MARTPLRETREKRLSSGERCGANTPAGRPEAPLAGASAASSTRTLQPRRARLAALAAPARPAPITMQRAGFGGAAAGSARWQQRATALRVWALQRSGLHCGLKPSR